ncbi:MAG: hypothetical protein SFW67_10175 [Myxococcaceae bacterium]|nr:hypothetical protein [Myxococcaceae bacterium]
MSPPATSDRHPPLALLDLGGGRRAWGWQVGEGTWVDVTRAKLPRPRRILSDVSAEPVRGTLGEARYPILPDHRDPAPLEGLSWGMTCAEVEAVTRTPPLGPIVRTLWKHPAQLTATFTEDGHLSRLEVVVEGLSAESLEAKVTSMLRTQPTRARGVVSWSASLTNGFLRDGRLLLTSTAW